MEAYRDGWSWRRRLEGWTGKGQRTVEAGRKPKADLQLVHFAVCWRVGRSHSGCPRAGARGGFWGHYLKAAGRSSSPAFPLPGLEAEMAHPAWSRGIKHLYGGDSWRMCGLAVWLASRWCGCGLCYRRSVHVTRVHVCGWALCETATAFLSVFRKCPYTTYTCDSTAESNHFMCPV